MAQAASPQPAATAPAAQPPAPVQAMNPVEFVNSNPPPPQPYASAQFWVGRWRVEGPNGSDLVYYGNGAFGGFAFQTSVMGSWTVQIMGPTLFRLQVWFPNMNTIAGTFQILDWDHVQNMEMGYIATRVR